MDSKRDGTSITPLRTSDRLRRRPKYFGRPYLYYKPMIRKRIKSKRRTAASQIVKKLLRPRNRSIKMPSSNSIVTNLRRSTRKRKMSINLEDYDTDTSASEDDDLMAPRYRSSKNKTEHNVRHDRVSASLRREKIAITNSLPRREGLRPRRSLNGRRAQPYQESEEGQDSSEDQMTEDETENGNDVDEDAVNEEDGDLGDDVAEYEDVGDQVAEDGDDEEGEEEHDGRKRYDLRNRAEVRRLIPEKEGKQKSQSPRKSLHQGVSSKSNRYLRKGGPRVHRRHRMSLPDDSDDSLLVDEMNEGPSTQWLRNRSGTPWPMGGLEMHGSTAWGLNVAASGWGYHGDNISSLTQGIQTAGQSSKGGADIQPLQVDESVSFEDIGGLSEYIDALKEMVFFPLLYPDFFTNYHITPPRGVLLCGPPGTGKTLIARALACAASKAGQKVSFYMRKGADVLSKWVGEAERQLKLLFEEAQKNQPSIIFFDEIDGLAPVRSSKQEQIHNSIVSTLLALMDGLDSRGQVVLIGATNRIDAIDGALRRPGRFDREFVFPLPGYEARAEILTIHTRKWKEPPSKELKMELAASCVGYCGADLKSLCTEAAIRSFREKYPQVYTSDDKFVIDVDSIRVERHHFIEAMSTITPAAHRGSIVHSRPLSSIIAPCLQRHLLRIIECLSDIFPFLSTLDASKLSVLSYGSAIPLVYRPRLLICGGESAGLDHVGPAVLHELEKFPVHSLGLPSLLSDPSAKTPEEALVHIFSEARRTTPSILYLPQFHIWWETADQQLKSVLMTLLAELPSNLPVLLIGTSLVPLAEMDEDATSIFALSNMYQVDKPTANDRSQFWNTVVEALLSTQLDQSTNKLKEPTNLPQLSKAPKDANCPKPSELKAKIEAEQHALRRLRMCLRDVCNRILYDKRFSAFHYPVSDEDAPGYHSIVHNPIDIATMLQRVDCGQYLTRAAFSQDIDLIASNAKAYNKDDYNGARIVSRAYELLDVMQGMMAQMDPALVSFCDKISSQGGPLHLDGMEGLDVPGAPVVQLAAVTRTSARLRNVQPEVSLAQSFEAVKRQKKNPDNDHTGSEARTTPEPDSIKDSSHSQTEDQDGSARVQLEDDTNNEQLEVSKVSTNQPIADENIADANISEQLDTVKQRFMERTEGYGIPELEHLYTRAIKCATAVGSKHGEGGKLLVLRHLLEFVEDDANF
ncbi:ATPase family AAA domain-containing protein At1g05910-like [Zingiber officinale]|uniref:ATPase family AAA domain-containing protein At1g05910-like n=1 Tax=Zingiber officinale TaxID=94328 RepID=UPI001C4B33E9|nr:ATPase family AAA domain-containing protein At1g05910-like [Zingiber officinale]